MRGAKHRVGSRKNRNGKSAKEKNQWRFERWPPRKLVKGRRGSTKNNPNVFSHTLGDYWP